MNFEALFIDFYNGGSVLQTLATQASPIENPQEALERLESFVKAYEQLIALHAAGKVGAGAADMSAENLDVAKRILHLVRVWSNSGGPPHSVEEIRTLAERCHHALTRTQAPPGDASQ